MGAAASTALNTATDAELRDTVDGLTELAVSRLSSALAAQKAEETPKGDGASEVKRHKAATAAAI
eukprot:4836053-Prymnesium_polylepis.1